MAAQGVETATGRKNAAELVAGGSDVVLAIGNAANTALWSKRPQRCRLYCYGRDRSGWSRLCREFVEARPQRNWLHDVRKLERKSGRNCSNRSRRASRGRRSFGNPVYPAGIGQFAVIQAAAPSQSLEATAINVSDEREIAQGIEAFAGSPNGGLIVTAGPSIINPSPS